MTYFFLVAIGSPRAKRVGVFTYSSDTKCLPGQVVRVELQKKLELGIVIEATKKPQFTTKPIDSVLPATIPAAQLKTLRWALSYYPTDQGSVVRLFVPPAYLPKQTASPLAPSTEKRVANVKLTSDQEKAIETISATTGISMLHGETGTGKTMVYIETIRRQIKEGKSVIVLAPEISLAEQLKKVIGGYFENVYTYNSLQTTKERRDFWFHAATTTEPIITIGPRSSLFLPLKNIGAIIIDEAHDASYKQQQSPYYTTLQMAARLSQDSGSKLIYGSATPNTSDYAVASSRGYPIIRLSERPVASTTDLKAHFHVVNLRDRTLFTKNPFLSNNVIASIKKSAAGGKQSLLLLNRRGTAQLIQCQSCAWQYRCEFCDHTLVYHKDKYAAICHYCARTYKMPSSCPEDTGEIRLLSVGTKFIEEQCRDLFPHNTILRIDADAVDRKTVADTMAQAASGEATILVGTQLLAKGLDLPHLENVIILDASRQSSDYLGDERYYQLLHQVIGRGMRGHRAVEIFLQTARPDDPIVTWAIKEDWHAFYAHELEERKMFHYPPDRHLAVFRYKRKDVKAAERTAKSFEASLKKAGIRIELLGPMPVVSPQKGIKEWQFILKSPARSRLVDAALAAPSDWTIDLDPIST